MVGRVAKVCAAGKLFAWCTIAALAGCVASDPAGRAVAACVALRSPVRYAADDAALGHTSLSAFRVGALGATPVLDRPLGLGYLSLSASGALAAGRTAMETLSACLLGEQGEWESEFANWAERPTPPPLADIPPDLLDTLPRFDDARLDVLAFPASPEPPKLDYVPLQPDQADPPAPLCPRSAFDLLLPHTVRRVTTWLNSALAHLVCVRDLGDECEVRVPGDMVVSQLDQYEGTRGVVWDFQRSPAECAVPLRYSQPIDATLNREYLGQRLALYPNQRVVGYVKDGVRLLAAVELHAYFGHHLVSLKKGFKSVASELRRLAGMGWYSFFAAFPIWPCYFNGQGSTSRKSEWWRWHNRGRRAAQGAGRLGGPPRALDQCCVKGIPHACALARRPATGIPGMVA